MSRILLISFPKLLLGQQLKCIKLWDLGYWNPLTNNVLSMN